MVGNLRELIPAFFTGPGGRPLSEEEIARRRQVAGSLLAQATDTSPTAGGGASVLAKAIQGLSYGINEGRADRAAAANAEASQANIAAMLGGSGAAPSVSAFPPAPSANVAATLTGGAPDAPSALVEQAHGNGAPVSPVNISGSQQAFIDALLPAAIEESKRTGVDPRIIVAQAAQETGWGRSAPGNNYFGIKSHGKAGGQTLGTHEYVNGKRVNIRDSFRTFDSPADSVRGYGDFLLANPRYRPLMAAQGLDAQLEALQASGYATDPNYSRSVGAIARNIQLPSATNAVAANEAMATGGLDGGLTPAALNSWAEQNYAPGAIDRSALAPVAAPASEVLVAESPEDIAAAELAMNDPAFAGPAVGDAAPTVAAAPAPAPAPVVAPQVAQVLTALPVNESLPMAGGVNNPNPIVPTAPQNPMRGLNPAVVQALSNPNATAQERAIAQALLQQHVAQNQALQEQARQQAEQANMLAQRRGLAGRMGIDPNYAVDDTIWKAATEANFRDPASYSAGSYIRNRDGTLEQVPEARTGDIQEYEYARQNGYQGSFTDYQQAIRRAGASQTTIDLGGKKFDEEFAKLDAQALGEVAVSGLSAQRNLGRIDQLETLLAAAPSGTEARFKQMAGEWGIPTEGLSEIQAAQALINSLVPEQRPAGSGPMSDADLELFKQSLPRVINQPGGNATIINTMRAIAQYDAEGAAIVQQLRAGDINRQEAFQMLQSRQNPLANFKAAPEQDGGSSADGWTTLPNGVKIRTKGAN